MAQTPLIDIQDIRIVREVKTILHPTTFAIQPGQHTAILGPNGCGKSTLIKAMTHEIYSHAGKGHARVDGRERWQISQLRTVLGVVSNEPKEPLLGEPTGLEIAVSGLIGTYGVLVQHDVTPEMFDKAWAALRKVEAEHLAHQSVETMSAGEHRRCFIARALVSEPKGLILDEPTTGLDIKARDAFMNTVRQLAQGGTTIILVTHHFEEVIPEIDQVILMKEGRIAAQGTRSEILEVDRICENFNITEPHLRRQIGMILGF